MCALWRHHTKMERPMRCKPVFRNIVSGIIFLLFTAVPLAAQVPDDPNIVEENGAYYYTIQKGDTLWDLSQRFYNTQWYWPELWKQNNDVPILNPHLIYPGQRIRVYPRKPEEPPMPAEAPMAPAAAPAEEFDMGPEPREIELDKGRPECCFYSLINRVGFIRKEPVFPSGVLFKVQGNRTMISKGDTVYIRRMTDEPLPLGGYFTIYRTFKPLKDEKTGREIGSQHYLTGVAEIVKNEPRFTIARIVQSFRTIYVNDLLMPYGSRSPNIEPVESKKGLHGEIIKAEEDMTFFGEQHIVFIDKGEKDGVKPGQTYKIYEQEKAELNVESGEEALLTPVDIGELFVLLAEPTTATAIITKSARQIEPGVSFRSPSQ